ncbi:hypothetical protein BASA81_001568 [Batrachochytrium salamandrivorans]|nr:hypothetical protein BASA81_001568 [Batrachochytrium salamandrivorans]
MRATKPDSVFNMFEVSSTSSSSSPSPPNDDKEEEDLPKLKHVKLSPPSPVVATAPASSKTITLLTFNVLADHLCKPNWFPYRTKDELAWPSRREHIKTCIQQANASIVCLQEVQTFVGPAHLAGNQDHKLWFESLLRQELGYSGVYGSRMNATGKESPGVQIGNLVYFKTQEFEPLLAERNVALVKTIHRSSDKETRKAYCHSGVRGTVASFVALECKTSKRRVLVVSTHLPAPRSDTDYHTALEQLVHTIALLIEIANFCARIQVDGILCTGDLNAMPNGHVCELLRTGRISAKKLKHVLRLAQQAKFPEALMDKDTGGVVLPSIPLRQPSPFINEVNNGAFFENALLLCQPPGLGFTNQTNIFSGWLDHVFMLSTPGTIATGSICTVDESVRCGELLLPCPESGYGSDHLPVLCTFTLLPYVATAATEERWIKHPLDVVEDTKEDEEEITYVIGDEAIFLQEFPPTTNDRPACVMFSLGGVMKRTPTSNLFIALKRLGDKEQVFMFDLTSASNITLEVKRLLEDANTTKVTFDSRLASDVLFHRLGITLNNVLDVQVYLQAAEYGQNPTFELAEPTQSWFPFLPTLEKAKTRYLSQSELEHLKRAKPPAGVDLTLDHKVGLEFMASMLASYDALLIAINRTVGMVLGSDLLVRVDVFCQWQLTRFRDLNKQTELATDRKLWLQEISIKLPVSGEDDFYCCRYYEQWVALGLVIM